MKWRDYAQNVSSRTYPLHMSESQPYIQIDTNLWAVMRYPKDHPVAMIVGMRNLAGQPQFFVQKWHPDPARRPVVSQHDTLKAANESVLWDLSVVEEASQTRVGPANGKR